MLISNSYSHGGAYLEHCAEAIKAFLGPIDTVTFIPYAAHDQEDFTRRAREGFGKFGIDVEPVSGVFPRNTINAARAIFVGGGNTFRLLQRLQHADLLDAIRHRVLHYGIPYLGVSAGANVACPTIKTTNDMPIVTPVIPVPRLGSVDAFNALDLFPYQINPHFIDADPASTHMGETREQRIKEFHEENDTPVFGLREGSWIVVEAGMARLSGTAKVFKKGEAPFEWKERGKMLDLFP